MRLSKQSRGKGRAIAVCMGLLLVLGFVGAADASDGGVPTGEIPSQESGCVENPLDSFRESIMGEAAGEEIRLTVSARFGGAVESLTWRGKEFINIWDHGRQISYAWGMDNFGECLNPTEPGSANDFKSPSSTSELKSVCKEAADRLSTVTKPAFWLAPGQTGFCSGGVSEAVNENPVAGQTLEKTMEIGYEGLENVIAFTAQVTLDRDYRSNQLEIPTAYLREEFSDPWLFNPVTDDLAQPESQPVHSPWSYEYEGRYPPILATEDGAYALGAYSTEDLEYYGLFKTNVADPDDRTNKWTIVTREEPAPAGTYTYRSFVIVGTLDQVVASIRALYELHPVDFDPPFGHVDVANCQEIAGWAWDPEAPNETIQIEIYSQKEGGSMELLTRISADNLREDLPSVLGDNGEHGYSVPTAEILPDGSPRVIKVYAVNSNPDLPSQELLGSGRSLECPGLIREQEPTAISQATLQPTPSSAPAADEPGPGIPRLPCLAGLLPAGLALLFTRRAASGTRL